jgi:2-C-methyl-D-erythritol 4-phosphate cytidylyltransferase
MKSNKVEHAIWAIVPAAGIGRRMQADRPKQYLSLNGRPVLEHTINTLLANSNISGLVIAVRDDDIYWPEIKLNSAKPVIPAKGGKERADSVLNALNELFSNERYSQDDWVMVHDAVRPCVRQQDINKLVTDVSDDASGGILALPVRDTMKRQRADSDIAVVAQTVERKNLWHALTPQYFPASALKDALQAALDNKLEITDESSAMEIAGFAPKLVEGHEDNIKITRPGDLALASLYFKARGE